MTEVLFYHLQRQPIERVLPALLEKSLERGWRVIVQAASDERVEALDAHLWTFRDDAFLPHGVWRDPEAREQPILLTVNDDNPNRASVRFLIDGVAVPADAAAYERIVLLFDGEGTGDGRAHLDLRLVRLDRYDAHALPGLAHGHRLGRAAVDDQDGAAADGAGEHHRACSMRRRHGSQKTRCRRKGEGFHANQSRKLLNDRGMSGTSFLMRAMAA